MAGITIDRIEKRFGAVTALKQLSLEVADGEFLALLGPSGCGKTTLLRIIAGMESADCGQVLFAGEEA
ncbi:MAG: ATP-binding cassette domain-containing protein, partial [Proteobacteria bacterium]|nr:ATP-binding cassette domain-containing protein [Pseudomonadota bacterium]